MPDLAQAAAAVAARHPGLDPGRVWLTALAENPEVARLHHAGLSSPAEPKPAGMVDAGLVLMEEIGNRVRAGASYDEARRATFAAMPEAVAAWGRGEAVVRPGGAPGGPGAPLLVLFRAELPAPVGNRLAAVPIFKVGTWNGKKYSAADLDAIVEAFTAGHYEVPITIGHTSDPAAPAVGRLAAVWRDGDVLLADFVDLDASVLDGIRTGRWLSLSAEIFLDMKRAGATYRAALRAVALLGAAPPGVDLPPLREALT